MVTIDNDAQLITSTNYWGSEAAQYGYAYFSTNAGAVRLLRPDYSNINVNDIKQTKFVVISMGPHADFNATMAEIMFVYNSGPPYVIYAALNQFDRIPLEEDYMKRMHFILVTPEGDNEVKNELLCQCVFRKSKKIPDLTPYIYT